MYKPTKEQSDALLEKLSKALGVSNILIVYGDHVEGKIDTMMCTDSAVDAFNFGENAIGAIQMLMRKIPGQGEQTRKE